MNKPKRLILGVLSCLLLAVGFARAADRFDPMSKIAQPSVRDFTVRDDGGATRPCIIHRS